MRDREIIIHLLCSSKVMVVLNLQVASIMGAGFCVDLLAAVYPMACSSAQLEADLQALAAARFLRPDDAAPGAWAWCQVRASSHANIPGSPLSVRMLSETVGDSMQSAQMCTVG